MTSHSTPRNLPKRREIYGYKNMSSKIPISFICNGQKMKLVQMFIHGWMVNKLVYPYNGTLVSNQKECIIDTWHNMGKS